MPRAIQKSRSDMGKFVPIYYLNNGHTSTAAGTRCEAKNIFRTFKSIVYSTVCYN